MRKLTVALGVLIVQLCTAQIPAYAEITESGAASAENKIAILAIGDSLTAGTMDGVTFEPTQNESWIAQLARQFGDRAHFSNPLFNTDGARVDPNVKPSNFAIPGLELSELATACKTIDLVEGIPVETPKFLQPYSGTNCVTPTDALLLAIDEAKSAGMRTWVFVWIGSNDLFFNFSDVANIDSAVVNAKTTDPKLFESEFAALLQKIAERKPDEVFVMTVPDLLQSAFFFTKGDLEFFFGREAAVEKLENSDLVPLLSAASDLFSKAQGKRVEVSNFGAADILTQKEQSVLLDRIDEYNSIISSTATKYGATLIDIARMLDLKFMGGVELGNGKILNRSWGRGGLFSLDGIHPSPSGQAVIANEVIAEISSRKKMWLPKIDLSAKYLSDPYRDGDGDGFIVGPVWSAPSGSVAELLRAFVDKKD